MWWWRWGVALVCGSCWVLAICVMVIGIALAPPKSLSEGENLGYASVGFVLVAIVAFPVIVTAACVSGIYASRRPSRWAVWWLGMIVGLAAALATDVAAVLVLVFAFG
jgi:hypothetical protein